MNKHHFRNDVLGLIKARGITLHRLASESGVEASSLWRFVNNERANLNTDSFFKLWPFVYGAQFPMPEAPYIPPPTTTPEEQSHE